MSLSKYNKDKFLGTIVGVEDIFDSLYELVGFVFHYEDGRKITLVADSYMPDQYSTTPYLKVE